jgi:hypothetical protein
MKQMLTHTHTHTHTQENKKWEIKTWEKWYWGIVEVLLVILAVMLMGVGYSNNKLNWETAGIILFLFVAGEIIFLIIWGIIKLIIWLVNRNKKEIDNQI